jgi:hypothetical protein
MLLSNTKRRWSDRIRERGKLLIIRCVGQKRGRDVRPMLLRNSITRVQRVSHTDFFMIAQTQLQAGTNRLDHCMNSKQTKEDAGT